MADLVIRGGRLVTSESIISAGVAVEGGRVVAIASDPHLPQGTRTIDVDGRYILPGLVDPETHTGVGVPLAEDLEPDTCAALASGITTWGFQLPSIKLDPELAVSEETPLHSQAFPAFQKLGDQCSRVDYFFTPIMVTEEQVMEIPKLAEAFGITSFKYYLHLMSRSRIDAWPPAKSAYGFKEGFDDGMVYLGLELTGRLGPPGIVCIHPQNQEIGRIFEDRLKKEGRRDLAAWNEASPPFCEAGHVRTYAYYARMANCPIYVQHVDTAETIEAVLNARGEGVEIFGQTGTDYLSLTQDMWKKLPPLRDRDTIDLLWQGLRDGSVDCTGTDHVNLGLKREEMVKDDVWSMMAGFTSRVEAHLPVLLSEGVNKGRISLPRVVRVACENPARIFGLYPKKGTIRIGSDGDFVIVDLNLTRRVTNDQILCSSGWTIYEGWEMKGWPVMVILRGEVVMEWPPEAVRPRIVGSPKGRYLPRAPGHLSPPVER